MEENIGCKGYSRSKVKSYAYLAQYWDFVSGYKFECGWRNDFICFSLQGK